uniref:Uncharacterized protein n=1 Tax=Arundo donax TaxID=35708 RepID=A0A0A9BV44_ARUDO
MTAPVLAALSASHFVVMPILGDLTNCLCLTNLYMYCSLT